MADQTLTFKSLVVSIQQLNDQLASQAGRAVNISLTLRNWLIGHHISEFELHGADRAKYGDKLLSELALKLTRLKVSNCNQRQLYRYAQFYRLYPAIVGTLSPQFKQLLPAKKALSAKVGTLSPKFKNRMTASEKKFQKVGTLSPKSAVPAQKLVSLLSYSHLELLVEQDDALKRAFYELECIRGNWSVRELRRQISSLYFERSGLSKNKKKLAALVRAGAEKSENRLSIRDPYVFEFLGIKPKEVMEEADLETALLDKIQEFLLELGHGFCFEARQKRILIGNRHFFIDLVLYHRVLKCHVLIELKVDRFKQEHLAQLNTYVSWYRKNMMTKYDNPPIGIILCTHHDHSLVEYALAGMNNELFVARYQVELPRKEQIQKFIEEQLRKRGMKEIKNE